VLTRLLCLQRIIDISCEVFGLRDGRIPKLP
jgi:hypothetical protein